MDRFYHERYQAMLSSPDPIMRGVAGRQLATLRRLDAPATLDRRARWAHVPVSDLFAAAGNAVARRRNGTLVCGHEPAHGSRSGTCVVIWPAEARWWCSSCRQGGNALHAVRSLRGLGYKAALRYLIQQYGSPDAVDANDARSRLPAARALVRGLVVESDA